MGDFTYLRCWEWIVYFAFVIDVFSRMIVGWQLAGTMRTTLVLERCGWRSGSARPARTSSWWPTPTPARITSVDYTQVLDDHRVLASIGSVGECV